MSITIHTKFPRRLRTLLFEGINEGVITSWLIDDESHLTLNSRIWRNRLWMHIANIEPKHSITFGIIGRKFEKITMAEFGVYHGRFAEVILANFADIISGIEIPSTPTQYDIVG